MLVQQPWLQIGSLALYRPPPHLLRMPDPITRLNAALEGRYAIERELGEGGMATVYLADDLKHERKVALKVLKPELAAVVGAERFLAEIKTTANLQHPHILPLFDSGEADSFLFYVMPFVEGETLRDRIDREKQLPVDEAVALVSKVAGALQHAHEHKVIHRDIKPGNILLQDGEPVVADFGIALAVGAAGSNRLTETGLSLGTPYYMSPEQATGDQAVGASTDTYALGSVLYEMLVGDPPYPGSTAQAVLGKIIAGKPVSATDERPSIPANVDAAIRKALEKLPADRFTSAQEFVRALGDEHFRYGELAIVGADVGGGPWNRLTMAITAVATVLLITSVWGWVNVDRPETVVTRFTVPVPGGIDVGFWFEEKLALSPDGRTIVYSTGGQLHRRSFTNFEGTPIDGTEGATSPFFSPDGEWLAFTQGITELKRVSMSGGPVVTIGNVEAQLGASWAANDEIIFAHALGTKGLWRMPADGGEPEPVTTVIDSLLETQHVWPQVLPEGDAVLFSVLGPNSNWSDAKIAIQDINGGSHQTVLDQATFGRYVSTGHLLYVQEEGSLFAVPFDLRQRRVTGPSFPVLADVSMANPGYASFTVAENGSLAYVSGTRETTYLLTWVDRSGVDLGQIGDPVHGNLMRLSPDGEQVAIGIRPPGNIDIWLVDVASGDRARFTFEPEEDETPVWSTTGEQLAYSAAGVRDARRVFVKPVDRSSERRLLYTGQHHIHLTDWSPDDEWLAYFEFHPQNGMDIWLIAADGSGEPLPVATTSAQESGAVFSPDGRWLAYQSDGTGRPEVYLVSFPELGGERQVSEGGGTFPRWAPQGDELFYLSGETLMSRAVSTLAGDLTLGVARPLFEYPRVLEFDVAPDGQRFVLRSVNEDAMTREIRVVFNWFEELERLVPN